MSLNWFSVSLAAVVVAAIFWLLRRDRLPIMHSLWWLLVAALIALLGIFPRLIDQAAAMVGVAYPPALLFVVAILVLLLKVLLEDVDASRDRQNLLRLAQKAAILEEELERLKGSLPPPGERER